MHAGLETKVPCWACAGHFFEYALRVPKDRKAWSAELGGPALPEIGGAHWRTWRALLKEEAGPKPEMALDLTEVMLQPATYGAMMENAHNGAPLLQPSAEWL
jgi:hypothetical protein